MESSSGGPQVSAREVVFRIAREGFTFEVSSDGRLRVEVDFAHAHGTLLAHEARELASAIQQPHEGGDAETREREARALVALALGVFDAEARAALCTFLNESEKLRQDGELRGWRLQVGPAAASPNAPSSVTVGYLLPDFQILDVSGATINEALRELAVTIIALGKKGMS